MSLDNTPPEENKPEGVPPEDNQYEEFRDQYEDEAPVDEETPASNGNRTFLRFIGIIGSIIVLAVLVLAAYFVFSRSRLASRFQEQSAQINAENTAVAVQGTQSSLQEMQAMTQKAILPATWTPPRRAEPPRRPLPPSRPTQPHLPAPARQMLTAGPQQWPPSLLNPLKAVLLGTPIAQATSACQSTPRATCHGPRNFDHSGCCHHRRNSPSNRYPACERHATQDRHRLAADWFCG